MNDMTSRVLAAVSVAAASLVALPAMASAAVLPATPATFHGVFSAAHAGDVIELAAGDYGDFTGAEKPGTVTIRALPGAAARMGVDFSSAGHLRLDGLTIDGTTISGSSHDITIANSRYTGQAVVRADQMVNANIVFDNDTFANIDVCGNCYEGRLQVAGQGPGPSGVTIENSTFGPGGDADGVQDGGSGVRILHNEFTGIRQIDATHTDALQLYGQDDTVISGNYFHGNDTDIMAPDGGDHELIADNVFVGDGNYRPAIQLGSQDTSQFVHNTVRHVDVFMDKKSDSPNASRNGVVRDNIFSDATVNAGPPKCQGCTVTSNLFDSGDAATGSRALVATPHFLGGSNPSSLTAYALAAGSPGKGAASDHTDMGARITPAAPAGGGTTQPTPPQASRPPAIRLALRVPRRIGWARLRRGLRVRVTAQEHVRLSFRLARKGAKRAMVSRSRSMAHGRRTFVLRPNRSRLGRRHAQRLVLTVTARNGAGTRRRLRRTIRVTP